GALRRQDEHRGLLRRRSAAEGEEQDDADAEQGERRAPPTAAPAGVHLALGRGVMFTRPMPSGPPRLCLAVTSLAAGSGGIARVARLMARTLAPEGAAGRVGLRTIGLYDRDRTDGLGVEVVGAGGSQLRYTAAVHVAALASTHFVYDSLA